MALIDDGVLRVPFLAPPPPFLRDGRIVPLPHVRVERPVAATWGSPVASRRQEGKTPAVKVAPGKVAPEKSTRPMQVLHYLLYEEGTSFVVTLLEQVRDVHTARGRLRAELQYLGAATARHMGQLHAQLDLNDWAAWRELSLQTMRSPFFLQQLGTLTPPSPPARPTTNLASTMCLAHRSPLACPSRG